MTTKSKSEKREASAYLEKMFGPLTIPSMLASERLCKEISHAEFARRLGISSANLCDIEKGRKLVSPERAALFAKKLKRLESLWVQVATQDLLRASGLRYRVKLEPFSKTKKRSYRKVA